MAIKYEKEKTYNTLRKMGIKVLEDGLLQLAERPERYGAHIETDEDLTFVERREGKLIFLRADGISEVIGHDNHFNPDSSYNTKEAPTGRTSSRGIDAKLKQLDYRKEVLRRAEMKRNEQAEKLAEFIAENPDVIEYLEDAGNKEFTPAGEDARSEAAALFAEIANG